MDRYARTLSLVVLVCVPLCLLIGCSGTNQTQRAEQLIQELDKKYGRYPEQRKKILQQLIGIGTPTIEPMIHYEQLGVRSTL
jgi:hypothetical protein